MSIYMFKCFLQVRFKLQLCILFKHKFNSLNTYSTPFHSITEQIHLMPCLDCWLCVWSRSTDKVWRKMFIEQNVKMWKERKKNIYLVCLCTSYSYDSPYPLGNGLFWNNDKLSYMSCFSQMTAIKKWKN